MKRAALLNLTLLLSVCTPVAHNVCATACHANNPHKENIGKIIEIVIKSPTDHHPHDILRALIDELEASLKIHYDQNIAQLCQALKQILNNDEKDAKKIISTISEYCKGDMMPLQVCKKLHSLSTIDQIKIFKAFKDSLAKSTPAPNHGAIAILLR